MKKTGLLLVLTLTISCLFVSCSDKDEPEDGSVSIVGEWYFQDTKYYIFNSNGTGEMLAEIQNDDEGYDYLMYIPIIWILKGNTLTLDINSTDWPINATVVTLTDKTLILRYEVDDRPVMIYTRG